MTKLLHDSPWVRYLVFVSCLIFSFPNISAAITRPKSTFDHKAKRAELILVGHVISTSSVILPTKYLDTVGSRYWVEVGLHIESLIVDKKNRVIPNQREIKLNFAEGIDGLPSFSIGEEVILMVNTETYVPQELNFEIATGEKYAIRKTTTSEYIVDSNNFPVVFRPTGNELMIENRGTAVTKANFLRELKKILKKQ